MRNHASQVSLTFPLRAPIASALLAFSFSIPALAQSDSTPPKDPILESDGTAKVTRNPDYVDVHVGVNADAEKASDCQAAAMKVMDATVAAINALNLPDQQLQTGTVDLSPRFKPEYSGRRDDTIIGYRATITLRIRTSDLKSPAKIIDTSLTAGCNRVDGVYFGIKEALEAREEAIKLAAKAAERKAKVLADALNLRIVRIVNASTRAAEGGYSSRNMYVQSAGYDGNPQPENGAIEAGQVEINATANISFAAVPK
ncbi:MAG: SIMPL domain-containing protein [Phycisphaerales bacterium]|nr:SIMPL domain-containing protein [Planctomycetota bacterium]